MAINKARSALSSVRGEESDSSHISSRRETTDVCERLRERPHATSQRPTCAAASSMDKMHTLEWGGDGVERDTRLGGSDERLSSTLWTLVRAGLRISTRI